MSLKEKIQSDITHAQKTNDEIRLSTLRMLNAALQNASIQKRTKLAKGGAADTKTLEAQSALTEDEMIKVVASEVKKRKESIESFEKGGRADLAKKELQELVVLQAYLPKQLSEQEVRLIIKDVIARVGATSQKDMGKVIKMVMEQVGNKAESSFVALAVKESLQ